VHQCPTCYASQTEIEIVAPEGPPPMVPTHYAKFLSDQMDRWGARTDQGPCPLPTSCNVRFGAEAVAIRFPAELVSIPPIQPCQLVSRMVDQALLPWICRVIDTYLTSRRLTLPYIAEISGLSPRTLQRRLADLGYTYSQLLDEVRATKAQRLLEDPCFPLPDITHHLGYASPSQFSRAFKRVSGSSPTAYRALHVAGGA
jgi:AraC-like DNA-binding protein